ncbi:MAG TPA: hypothetical protein VH280_11945 [Verrucomicrobiae bacterium]|jgi:hypothetical protein|nr:hypothetical protein [Verrucomicrobiae bacterium]
MKIVISQSARDDLADGYWFYEDQGKSLGVYFLESLFSDVDSLTLYAGIRIQKPIENCCAISEVFCRAFPNRNSQIKNRK